MKPIILVFARYYLPGYLAGGPIRTIANMVDRLSDDFEFRIVTSDRDFGDLEAYPDIEANSWMPRGRGLVRYVSLQEWGMRQIIELAKFTPHDVIYLNSFFDPRFTQLVLLAHRLRLLQGRPIVLAPRGEFSEGALALKSLKKSWFIRIAKLTSLYSNLAWQASSEHELADIKRSLGNVVVRNVSIAANLSPRFDLELEAGGRTNRRIEGSLRIGFLARICRMKNLAYALRVLGQVRAPVHFSVYGPVEDHTYWSECQSAIGKLPPHIQVVYHGPVKQDDVVRALTEHDLFFLPTRGENFGHIIHEALRAGLPLLISDQTPWRGLAGKGIGWDLPLSDPSAFAQKIEEVAAWSDSKRAKVGVKAKEVAQCISKDASAIDANRSLFFNAIAGKVCAES